MQGLQKICPRFSGRGKGKGRQDIYRRIFCIPAAQERSSKPVLVGVMPKDRKPDE
jgi:hypothetical protein